MRAELTVLCMWLMVAVTMVTGVDVGDVMATVLLSVLGEVDCTEVKVEVLID